MIYNQIHNLPYVETEPIALSVLFLAVNVKWQVCAAALGNYFDRNIDLCNFWARQRFSEVFYFK